MLRIKALILALGTLIAFSGFSQVIDPVKWSFEIVDLGEEIYDFQATATMDDTWHTYANVVADNPPPDFLGPFPTEFIFPDTDTYELVGEIRELGERITHFDPQFDAELNYFEGVATWAQKFKVAGEHINNIDFELSYQACNEEMCIFPPPVELRISCEAGVPVSVAEGPFDLNMGGSTGAGGSEVVDPVDWTFASEKLANGNYALLMTATMEGDWHVYSQHLNPDEGPLPTVFTFSFPEGVTAVGEVQEPEPVVEYDPNFMLDLAFFSHEVVFTQEIAGASDDMRISASVDYMACNDETCTPPLLEEYEVDLATGVGREILPEGEGDANRYALPGVDLDNPVSDCGEEKEDQNLWVIFLLGFGGGLVALLTPCVFPMIPLTVSFFTKGTGKRGSGIFRAVLYGFFIFLIYISLSLPFHIWKIPPETLNVISTSATLNIFFFVVFVVFAISFFGYFEITMPASWSNKADNQSNKGGILGIFFMALTLALVSFSCTGPILGSVLAETISKGPNPLTAAMAGFGIALGLPFAIFAMFPGMMDKLPKSGGWLNSVKVVLGFAELALAVKFLSNADLVYQWGILQRETFFLIWTIIAFLTALYLMGFIKFPHDSKKTKLSPIRIGFLLAFLGFGVYLFPGVLKNPWWNHNVLSGFPPPKFYSWYFQEGDSKCPLALDCTKDFYEGVEMAKAKGQPVFLDFTGWACVNCRKMEDNVWPTENIYKILANEVQVVSLYVDDKRARPDGKEEVVSITYQDGTVKPKRISTIGDMWSTLEILSFANSTQPLYVMLTPEGELLTPPKGYTPNSSEYEEWLRCGLDAYKEKQVQASNEN